MDVVDAHLHLFKTLSDDYPRAIFEGITPPEREESAERLLAAMDAAGVDRAIYCALSEHDHYLAEVLADHPGKFAGVSVYDFADPDPLATLRRRIDAGIEGVRFYGLEGEPGADPESLAVFPTLAAMRDADMLAWFLRAGRPGGPAGRLPGAARRHEGGHEPSGVPAQHASRAEGGRPCPAPVRHAAAPRPAWRLWRRSRPSIPA